MDHVISEDLLRALRIEAAKQFGSAILASSDKIVEYRAKMADCGDIAISFLNSADVTELLRALLGGQFSLNSKATCYTYYASGDFLGRHQDLSETCAATVILYLEATSPEPPARNSGLILEIYGSDEAEKTSVIDVIKTKVGTLVVGSGSRIWHGRPPLQDGEFVAGLTACFELRQASVS
jgi:hypothetical protein